jgi:hypothetical protein
MILEAMDGIRVEAALLRANLPELTLREGMTLPGRVLERAGAFGVLMLAGAALSAELPENLAAGTALRLRVEEVSADRVLLRALEPQAPPPAATPPADVRVQLPGGRAAEVRVTEDGAAGPDGRRPTTIVLDYASPALGALDFKLVHRPGAGLQVTVGAVAGRAEDHARAAAEELREALSASSDLPVTVTVISRPPEPRVDVYA